MKNLSFYLLCSLLAYSTSAFANDDADGIGDYENHHKTHLSCPEAGKKDGTLVSISENALKHATRVKAELMNEKIKQLEIAASDGNSGFHTVYNYQMDKLKSSDKFHAESVAAHIESLFVKVCNGTPSEKKKYFDELAKNKKMLRKHWGLSHSEESFDKKDESKGANWFLLLRVKLIRSKLWIYIEAPYIANNKHR